MGRRGESGRGLEADRLRLLPGGYGRSSLMVGGSGPVAERADGPWIWFSGGRRLADFNNNFASLVHGHAHPLVTGAAVKALAGGPSYGASNELEVVHAAALLDRLVHADKVRYTNSGTEAVMVAIRLARAATGRSRIVLVDGAYHGTADAVLPALGAEGGRGVPPAVAAETRLTPINDAAALERIFAESPLPAALVVDPIPNRLGMTPVTGGYLRRARELCDEHGAVLIVDEVISLRLAYRGLADELGVVPDLTVAGKLIGGGFPVGAVAGSDALMEELSPLKVGALEHGGTFASNPVSMAAGAASMELLTTAEIERINALGDDLRAQLERPAGEAGWEVAGRGSALRLVAAETGSASPYRDIWWAAFHHGVLMTPSGLLTLSTPMDAELVDGAARALTEAFDAAAAGRVEHGENGSRVGTVG